jgi:hypothetical protein
MRGIELMKYDLQLEVNEFDNHPDIDTNELLEYLHNWKYRTEMMQELDQLCDMEEQEEALRQYNDHYDYVKPADNDYDDVDWIMEMIEQEEALRQYNDYYDNQQVIEESEEFLDICMELMLEGIIDEDAIEEEAHKIMDFKENCR